jgi:hypothetical protein
MAAHMENPLAFMSYSHFDNEHTKGNIATLCKKLSEAVQAETGREFPIFLDNDALPWGPDWQEKIKHALDTVTFFIPVITPSFFGSPYCLGELRQFLDREPNLARADQVRPILYIDVDLENLEFNQDVDLTLARTVLGRQSVNWTENRLRKFGERKVREQLAILAKDIALALKQIRNSEQAGKAASNNERLIEPRHRMENHEQHPPRSIFVESRPDNPTYLLEWAMEAKAAGDYQMAKTLHKRILESGVDWTSSVGLFIDQMYFSISLHDKLEDWQELRWLDERLFRGMLARIESVVVPESYRAIRTMYQASMALAQLRQTQVAGALQRIMEVLAYPPPSGPDMGPQILYANALVSRALTLHASWTYGGHDQSRLTEARNDLSAAENIYRTAAKMEQEEEFHHLGRFYGARAFLALEEWKRTEAADGLKPDAVLDDSRRAHDGKNRTKYGKIAGRYCDAFCHFQIGLKMTDPELRQHHISQALLLLERSRQDLEKEARLAQVKVTGLGLWVSETAVHQGSPSDSHARLVRRWRKLHASANRMAQDHKRNFLAEIPMRAWLSTPLN